MNSGLVLRPQGAVITGKMFGYGIYFADRAKKSLGYTSLDGSYWARGRGSTGFMSLYNVHTGKPLKVTGGEYWSSSMTEKKLKQRGNYDSLFATKSGGRLYNNEYIIYNDKQCTINYLVELGK